MSPTALIQIIKNGESSKWEFKTQDDSLAQEIVSFANFEGGTILIGVDDSGKILGYTRNDMEEFVINVCRNNVRPSIIPIIEKQSINDKKILIVEIPRGDTVYSTTKGNYFIRVGSTKQIPTQQELLRLFQRRNMLQFDETPVLKASIKSIDLDKVSRYLKRLGQSPLNEEDEDSISNDLINLSIATEIDNKIYPTFAGLLAFGKNPQRYFPSFCILCGAYKGRDFESDTILEKDLNGTLTEQIENAVSVAIPQDYTLERGIQRRDKYAYPIEALREGIINAVCHRDYTITGSSIRIFYFSDRIEIRSPGGLPNTLTLENMLFRQYTRNQSIASFLAGSGYMERRGKGLLKIISLCKADEIKCEFSLTSDKSGFVLICSIQE